LVVADEVTEEGDLGPGSPMRPLDPRLLRHWVSWVQQVYRHGYSYTGPGDTPESWDDVMTAYDIGVISADQYSILDSSGVCPRTMIVDFDVS
jgi:hypothetical protein